jgi:hypothetical protein
MNQQLKLKTPTKLHNFILVGGDTDGLAFKKPDQSPFTKQERESILAGLNDLMDGLIKWEDDGVFKAQLVIKTKNYVLVDENGRQKTKGSALKATTKEKALQGFVQEVIQLLLNDGQEYIYSTYMRYAKDILAITDMASWCSKHTITKAVLEGKGTAQVRIREALKGRSVQEGDKVYMFFKTDTERCLLEDFDGTYCKDTLLGKLYDTLCVFETVLDVKQYPNLTLKRNKAIREQLEVKNG